MFVAATSFFKLQSSTFLNIIGSVPKLCNGTAAFSHSRSRTRWDVHLCSAGVPDAWHLLLEGPLVLRMEHTFQGHQAISRRPDSTPRSLLALIARSTNKYSCSPRVSTKHSLL
ncbi:hypothetical protein MN608_09150 [Microdochium nivale]|nr:hypothetical protein MN608_09150 [Microdochium nivale]